MAIGHRYSRHREVTMKNPLMLGAVAATVALLAGCGSSSKTTSSTTSAAGATGATGTSASSASKSPYSGGTPAAAAASGAGTVLVTTKHSKLGTVLAAGPKKLSVYLFEADTGGKSACSAGCARVWPPVTTNGTAQTGGGALGSDVGTIVRSDGTRQVTYKGHPLYFFAKDKDDGDSYGQGIKAFGSSWYVLAPSGNKIDNS
jgi:predicted lipoprotein with Yx(FWY)xxD motif